MGVITADLARIIRIMAVITTDTIEEWSKQKTMVKSGPRISKSKHAGKYVVLLATGKGFDRARRFDSYTEAKKFVDGLTEYLTNE
jgi:hypothetical protein